MILLHTRLIEQLDYDPLTGIFTWRANRRGVCGGAIAGAPSGGDEGGSKYWLIRLDKHRYYAHNLAWFYVHGVWPVGRLDHEDLDGWNNAILNLRPATVQQNAANTIVRKNNRIGFKGVRKRKNRYEARISAGRKEKILGHFDTPQEAHAAYCAALQERFGEYARG